MKMESEGDMTPEELCQFIMDTIMKNAELITIKTEIRSAGLNI